MNEEIGCITEERPRMNGKMTPTFIQLYTLYIKNWDNSFSIFHSQTCLNKDTSVLLQVINL